MNYLELDDVLAIACEVLGLEVNALLHVTDVGLADSAVARPRAGFAGEEFHPTLEAKAASLLLGLARNHAFIGRFSLFWSRERLRLRACSLAVVVRHLSG